MILVTGADEKQGSHLWANYYHSNWPRPVFLVQKVLKIRALTLRSAVTRIVAFFRNHVYLFVSAASLARQRRKSLVLLLLSRLRGKHSAIFACFTTHSFRRKEGSYMFFLFRAASFAKKLCER